MATLTNKEKKFVVLAILDEDGSVDVFDILAEDHDVACHYAEISLGPGAFISLNKNQARKVYRELKSRLQSW